MGYKYSKNTIPRVAPYLDQLLPAKEHTIDFVDADPIRLARWLYEAISLSAKEGKDYGKIRNNYRFRVLKDRVRAELRDVIIEIPKAPPALIIKEATTMREVVGAILHHKAPNMEFPEAVVTQEEFTRLADWATSINYTIVQNPFLKAIRNAS